MAIVNPKTGKRISNVEIKKTIMNQRRWTSARYEQEKRKLQKQIETRQAIFGEEKKNAVEILYKNAISRKKYGKEYKPSAEFQRLTKTKIASKSELKKPEIVKKFQTQYNRQTSTRFAGFLKNHEYLRKMANKIKDPVAREKFLTEYANKLHENIENSKEKAKRHVSGIGEIGETYGSVDSISDEQLQNIVADLKNRGFDIDF